MEWCISDRSRTPRRSTPRRRSRFADKAGATSNRQRSELPRSSPRFCRMWNGIRVAAMGISAVSRIWIGYHASAQLGSLERFDETLSPAEVYRYLNDNPLDAREELKCFL